MELLTSQEQEVLDTLDKWRGWYKSNSFKRSINVNELLNVRDMLSTWNSNLGEMWCDWERRYEESKLEREMKFEEIKRDLILKNETATSAENQAKILTKQLRIIELTTYSIYKKMKIKHEDIREICQAVSQRIATLRNEKSE